MVRVIKVLISWVRFNFELDTLYLDWGYGFADVDGDDEDGDEELLFQFLPLDLSDDVKKN